MIDSGDTAWVLTSSALVFIMVPGLAFFYAGLVRGKNALSTLLQSFIALAIVGLSWILWGYSLAFGPDIGGFIGNLQWAGLHGVSATEAGPYADTIPHQAFMVFQAKFAIITPALIAGAFAERIKFSTFVIFIIAWSTIVYPPLAHWMWGSGGWLGEMGALDFAGGAVVHISSGAAALAAAIIFGRRLGLGHGDMNPHNVPFVGFGRLSALVWLVRFQRRQFPYVDGSSDLGICGHPCLSCDCCAGMGFSGLDLEPETQRCGSGHRSSGRPSDHHSGIRLCRSNAGSGHWVGRRRPVLCRRLDEDPCEA